MYPNTATISLLPLDPANGYAPSFVIFGGAVRALGGCWAICMYRRGGGCWVHVVGLLGVCWVEGGPWRYGTQTLPG